MRQFQVIRDFEEALARYTGAPFVVCVNSCTMALRICMDWQWRHNNCDFIDIPKKTYVSVPIQAKQAKFKINFVDLEWKGSYRLTPFNLYDAARSFHKGMYKKYGEHSQVCVSFHWTKILGLGHGGAILHDNEIADSYLRQMRHDGRMDGMPISNRYGEYSVNSDNIVKKWPHLLGHHCPMSPEVAAQGLVRLANLPEDNEDLPNSDYPDLSTFEVFK